PARRDVAEDDAPAAPRRRRHAHHAGNHEIDVAIDAVAPDHDLVALAADPFALRGDLAQAVAVQALEQVHFLQADERGDRKDRFRHALFHRGDAVADG